ncbi:MAG: nucleotidyltransferase family protein [Chloroflexi bacterium]|nr:nucleotidyltransferase family protein [Chloroflexota bacterium]
MEVAAINLWMLSRLGEILATAHRVGVPVIVLKGGVLLRWLYRLNERRMNDIDVLVRPSDSARLIRALGLRALPRPEQGSRRTIRSGGPAGEFVRDFAGLQLDIHHHVLTPAWLRRVIQLDDRGAWERAESCEIAGQPALRLSPEDQLIHLVGHTVLHHADWSAAALEDVRRLLESTQVRWPLVGDLIMRQRLATAMWVALSSEHVRHLVPESFIAGLRPRFSRRLLVRVAVRLKNAGDANAAQMLLTDRLRDPVLALPVRLLPSPSWLESRYPALPTDAWRLSWHVVRVLLTLLRVPVLASVALGRALRDAVPAGRPRS